MGETIDANPDAGARRKRIPTRVFVLSSMLLVVLLAGVGLAQCTDADDAAPDASDTVPQSPEAETSESTGSAPTTLTPNVSDPIESSVPLGTVDPVGEPSTQDAATSVMNFLDRIPVAINPTAIENTSGADSTTDASTDISEIVTGAMADEVLATAAEFEAMGWTQSGTPEIVDVRVVRAPTLQEPLDAVVEVCLDNSGVQILNESGRDVRPPDTPERSLNIFVLRRVDATWLVAERTFPDDPNC